MEKRIDPKDYLNLGYKVVHRFLKINPHLYLIQDDLEQEGMLAVCEAAAKFKDQGKIKFTTYCARHVQNSLLNYLRDFENKFSTVRRLEDLKFAEDPDGNESNSWEELIPGSVVDIETTLNKLPAQCQVFASMVIRGMTKQEIREAMGCSWEHLDDLKEQTINHLDKILV